MLICNLDDHLKRIIRFSRKFEDHSVRIIYYLIRRILLFYQV